MNCDRVHDLISEAIDGTLTAAEAERFRAHLDSCPPCRALFGDVKESIALLEELPTIEPRPDFERRVWAMIRQEPAGLRARLGRWLGPLVADGAWLRWAPVGAAAVLLGWLVVVPPHGGEVLQASLDAVTSGETQPLTAEEAAELGGFAARDVATPITDPEFAPVEYPAGIPEQIELLLSEAESRELRLNPDRYRNSSWQYPLRSVPDPLAVSATPVSSRMPAAPRPAPSGAEPGVPVFTF